MFKHIKYEIRKNLWAIFILLVLFIGTEGFFLINIIRDDFEYSMMGCAVLGAAGFVAYGFVIFYAIVSYSKELTSKSSYLTFMTPVSGGKIIASKVIYSVMMATAMLVVVIALCILDFVLLDRSFEEFELMKEMIDIIMNLTGTEKIELYFGFLSAGCELLYTLLSVVAMAYFSITLTATTFQNKKYKGILSFCVFVIVIVCSNLLITQVEKMVGIYDLVVTTQSELFIAMIPCMIIDCIIVVVAFILSSKLLEKKVSL